MRLRTKILLLSFLSTAALGGMVAVTATVVMTGSLRDEIRQKGLSNAVQATDGFAAALVDGDYGALSRSLVRLLEVVPESHYAYVVGMDGEIAGHTFAAGFPRGLLGANEIPAAGESRIVTVRLGPDRIMDIGRRIIPGSRAELHLGMSEKDIADRSYRLLAIITLISIGAVLGGMSVAVALANRYTRPLHDLARHAASFGETGEAVDLPVRSGDEVGTLTATFNTMARNLARTLEEVEASEARYRTLVETAMEGVVSIDREGRITFANERLKEMTGWGRDEVVGRSILDFIRPGQRGFFAEQLSRRGRGEMGRYELTILRPDGTPVEVMISASPLVDAEGRHVGSFGLLTDISEMKRTETALRQAHSDLEARCEELKKVDAIKDGLIRDVSHELKTPVAKVAMQMELLHHLLAERGLLGEAAPSLDVIGRAISRQQQVIRNILNLARLEERARRYRSETMRLDGLVVDVLGDYREAIDSYGVEVTRDLDPLSVSSDREMLWHVVSNLVTNALKFRRPGGCARIDVAVRRVDGAAEVTIADNGMGMDPAELEHAFERFYQATPTTEGSGVGLTICRRIVEDLGGTIRIESPGHGLGTTVTFRLPAGEA